MAAFQRRSEAMQDKLLFSWITMTSHEGLQAKKGVLARKVLWHSVYPFSYCTTME